MTNEIKFIAETSGKKYRMTATDTEIKYYKYQGLTGLTTMFDGYNITDKKLQKIIADKKFYDGINYKIKLNKFI